MFQVNDDIWEIGYWIGKPYWGQGYVTEAAAGLLAWAQHEMGVTRFVSGHIFDNPASGKVLTKLGFTYAGDIEMYVKGRDCSVVSPRYILNAPIEVALKTTFARPKE
jgi:RimJ/RimL family protein N-acetyltransferase